MNIKKHLSKIIYADDDTESVWLLLRLRIPPLILGLVLGIVISIIMSKFEAVLARNIRAAFFLPFIVYIADAVGAQTQNIYTRDLQTGKARFHNYLVKESVLGLILGSIFGAISWGVVIFWLNDNLLALSVGLSIALAISFAPLLALLIVQAGKLLRQDPAAEAGPIATVIQDMMSVVIYGLVSSAIIL